MLTFVLLSDLYGHIFCTNTILWW